MMHYSLPERFDQRTGYSSYNQFQFPERVDGLTTFINVGGEKTFGILPG
jgi:hypothetical protein